MKFNRNFFLFLAVFIFLIGFASAGNYNLTLTGTPDYLDYTDYPDGQPNAYLVFDGNWSTFGNTTDGYLSWGYYPSPEAIANSSLIKSARWNIRTSTGDHNFTLNVTDCFKDDVGGEAEDMINVLVYIDFLADCLSDVVLLGNITGDNFYENTFVYEIENDTIENVVITNPSVTSSPIYQAMESTGAGLAVFIEYMNKGFPILLLGLMLVAIFVIIGSGIKILIKKFSHSHK